jgi:hypothetical protein
LVYGGSEWFRLVDIEPTGQQFGHIHDPISASFFISGSRDKLGKLDGA